MPHHCVWSLRWVQLDSCKVWSLVGRCVLHESSEDPAVRPWGSPPFPRDASRGTLRLVLMTPLKYLCQHLNHDVYSAHIPELPYFQGLKKPVLIKVNTNNCQLQVSSSVRSVAVTCGVKHRVCWCRGALGPVGLGTASWKSAPGWNVPVGLLHAGAVPGTPGAVARFGS